MLIGAGHWLHVPVGKLHDDRYRPLHPHLVTLIGDYRAAHVSADNPLLLPRENGRPLYAWRDGATLDDRGKQDRVPRPR